METRTDLPDKKMEQIENFNGIVVSPELTKHSASELIALIICGRSISMNTKTGKQFFIRRGENIVTGEGEFTGDFKIMLPPNLDENPTFFTAQITFSDSFDIKQFSVKGRLDGNTLAEVKAAFGSR